MAIRPSEFILMTLKTGRKIIGLSIHDIQEIIEPVALAHVPVTAPSFEGFIYFRQQILPLIDLVQMLGEEPYRCSDEEKYVIISSSSFSAALRIDGVGDTITCSSDPVPSESDDKTLNVLLNTSIRVQDQQIPLLNLDKLRMQIEENNLHIQQENGYGLND
ncbi:MAG: chemotaxis protein CheW [Sporolactobacillus sp.]